MAALVDTSILVYRFDPRFPNKQTIATRLLRTGIEEDSVRLPHQAIVEFVAAVTRPIASGPSLLSVDDARQEAEELLLQFTVLYPNDELVRMALQRNRLAYEFHHPAYSGFQEFASSSVAGKKGL